MLQSWHRTGTAAWCAYASVIMIIVQMVIYVLSPPPDSAAEFFELLLDNPVQGVISLDLFYIVSNTLAYVIYLALAVVLWSVNRSAVAIAFAFCVVGIAASMAAPRPVEMLTLAHAYADADAATRVALLAVGDSLIATWQGTAFDIYYFFTLVTLLILTVLMVKSAIFSRATAIWGLASAALMVIPTNFGPVGLACAISSLLPFGVFVTLVGHRLFQLAGRVQTPVPVARTK